VRPPSHRLRFLSGLLLGAGLGAWLVHGFVSDARRRAAGELEVRQAVVALQAVTSLVERAGGEGEAVRRVVAAWQAGTPGVASLRIARGMQLEASTAPGDSGDRAAPRRLAREEKPLYDRAQRISTAVQTNREEQAGRKDEIEVERLPDRRLSLAAPLVADGAVAGIVEIESVGLPPPPATPWWPSLLAALAPAVAFGVLSLLLGERRAWLAVAATACLAASLLVLVRAGTAQVAAERQEAAAVVAGRVKEQAALVGSVARAQGLTAADGGSLPEGAAWDVDAFRQPRSELTAEGKVDPARLAVAVEDALRHLRRSLLAAAALALALLLLVGLGAFHRLGRALSRNRQAYLYIAPAILGMMVLVFYPFSYGIALSFTDSNIYNTNRHLTEIWVGLRNYLDILGDFAFARRGEGGFVFNYLNFYWTLLFTVVWTVTNVTIGVSSGLFLALILNTRALALRPVYRVLLILPWAMPNYITALIWKGMFHQQFGIINQLLQMAGLPAVNWFDHTFTSYLAALTTNAWLSFPFMMVVSLGALQSIPADLYEAARVDGASRWQAFRAITLPSLRPALVPAVILSVVWTFNMFNIIYLVTAGDPGGSTEILITQAYKFAFEKYRYGYAAAYSTVIFGILLVYGVFQNRYSRATEA
jgi:arabinogalactan oligomer/maltooligosaccharide transport system permease protein